MSRPRVWTLDGWVIQPGSDDLAPDGEVRVIEWDREKVEAALVKAMTDAIPERNDAAFWSLARAIFDALDPEG